MKRILLFIVCLTVCTISRAADDVFPVKRLGNTIYSGVFTGNGLLGSMTYLKSNDIVRIDVGRTDVFDHRVNNESSLFDKARLPIGHFEIQLNDTILQASGEIAYRKGYATAEIESANTAFQIKTLTFAHRNLIYIELSPLNETTSLPSSIVWKPEKARSPRMAFLHTAKPDHYDENPDGGFQEVNGITVYEQPLLAGGGYATAWKSYHAGNKLIYVVSIGYDTQSKKYVDKALSAVSTFSIDDVKDDLVQHEDFWKTYYGRSTLTIPDTNLQQFYNMQLYKLGSATGEDKPAIDLQGPWTANTPWPAYWHNLNTQLTYSPTFTSNHLEISASLIHLLDRNIDNLNHNVPEAYRYNSVALGRSSAPDLVSPVFLERGKEDQSWDDGKKELGNLTWLMHSYYQYYRHSMDSKVYDRLFPLLKRAVNYYLHLLEKNEAGDYHIGVRTHSPEYPRSYHFDTNYDLSILRWGLKTLLSLDDERGGMDPLHQKWSDVLANLRDYPQNEDGFMIAQGLPYAQSHRHYSHLMMIYPFYLVNWDQVDDRELITRSVAHWQSKVGALQGYSFSGAVSMYAMMGNGDDAERSLQTLLRKYVKPNTLYAESGPVIETPLAAMSSIQEICLQYWNGIVRVFPAVPTSWTNVSFENFLTDGAFLISASYTESSTASIIVESQHTGNVIIKNDIVDHASVEISGNGKVLKQGDGQLELYLAKGAIANITRK